jgi:hypothetical protein
MTADESPPSTTGRVRSPRLMTAGVVATAVGAAGVGAAIPSLISDASALSVGAAAGFAVVAVVGAGLIQRGRPNRIAPPVTPVEESAVVEPKIEQPTDAVGDLPERYRQWVLAQALGDDGIATLDAADAREVFMLSSTGVATVLAWLREQDRASYSVERWVDEILPGQGIHIADRGLAIELLAGAGEPQREPTTERAIAMATLHVGLLRLYCGIGARPAGSDVTLQFDETPSSIS